jgi:DNA-binding IclR family transcriptional regulator
VSVPSSRTWEIGEPNPIAIWCIAIDEAGAVCAFYGEKCIPMSRTRLPQDNGSGGLDSLDAGLSVLESLSHRDQWSTLGEISSRLGLSKSRVFRILATLKRRGFVEQPVRGGPYRLGKQLEVLSGSVLLHRTLPRIADPLMEELSHALRGTVVLRILEADEQVTLQCAHSPEVLRTSYPVGSRLPGSYGSTGRVLLAFQAADVVERVLNAAPPSDLGSFRAELEQTRKSGFALNLEETALGVRSVAAPVLDPAGHAVASIAVSFPALALPRSRIPKVAQELQATCDTIQSRLGYSSRPRPAAVLRPDKQGRTR